LGIDEALIKKTLNTRFIYDIDELLVSKILGFKNADDYYEGISW
jgi:predicted alpha/beta-fold hydrolase